MENISQINTQQNPNLIKYICHRINILKRLIKMTMLDLKIIYLYMKYLMIYTISIMDYEMDISGRAEVAEPYKYRISNELSFITKFIT